MKLFDVTCRKNLGTTFWGCASKIRESKKRTKFSAILDNFRLIANNAGTDQDMDKRRGPLSTTIPPTFDKNRCTLVH